MKSKIKKFILENTLSNPQDLHDDLLIFEAGLLDSMGFLFLVEYIAEEFKIEVLDEDLSPENFGSITKIEAYLQEKLKIST